MDSSFIDQLWQKMQKSVEVTREDLATIRTGRATPALVEHITITAYDGTQKLKLNEMATVTASDAATLIVQPFDPTTIEDILKGIHESGSGLTGNIEGEVMRVNIPALSEERRQEFLRLAKTKLEAGKVMIRQIRQEAMQQVKRDFEAKALTEDDKARLEKQVQELTDEMVKQLDGLGERKEKELLQV